MASASRLKSPMTFSNRTERPVFVTPFRHRQRVRLIPFQPLLRFYSHVQRQLTVNTVNTFMIEPKAFYITWIQVAEATTPVFLAIGYTDQPVNNNAIFFTQFGLVTITTFSDNKQLAGKAYADISISDRLLRHLLSKRWPHHLWTHRFYARIPPGSTFTVTHHTFRSGRAANRNPSFTIEMQNHTYLQKN